MVLREQCRRSFLAFVDQCQILSELAGGTAADWIPFRLWPAQKEVAQKFQHHRLVIALKARQLGLTWLALAFALWHLILHPVATILLFSKRDDEATDLLYRLKEMAKRLPSWLQPGPALIDNDHEYSLPNGSRALAFPTTAGDSYTATLAIVDEADLIPDLDALLRAVKPTVDSSKGRLILVSRANKSEPESAFKRIYRAAQAGGSDWHPVFLPWHARPDRDPSWYEAQRRDIRDRTGSLDDLHEQYPASDAEALAARSLNKRLPAEWLLDCYEVAPAVILGKGTPALPGLVVFSLPQPGNRYVIGADPAEGNPTSDESALCVLDEETGEEVAFLAGRFEPATFSAHVATIGRWFNFAPVLVERNQHGHAVILWLRENAPSITRLVGHDGMPGWHTTGKSKCMLYDNAGEVLRDGEACIRAIETYHQLSSIEGSTLRAPEGQEDDRATAFILGLQARTLRRRWGKTTGDGPCVLTDGKADPYAPDWGLPQGKDWRAGNDGSIDGACFIVPGPGAPLDPWPPFGSRFIPFKG
jgi:hypothetical protein